MSLYAFMTKMQWKGNDDTKTLMFVRTDLSEDNSYSLSVWCKPIPYEANDFDEEHRQNMLRRKR